MPHYSGTVNNWTELRSELVNACVLHGWLESGSAITKGSLVADLRIVTSENTDSENGEGLHIEGGTGYSSGLVEPSLLHPRMGPPSRDVSQAQWPMDFDIHIFTAPVDEVYMVVRHSVDYYWWIAFGQSVVPVPGTGMWLAGNSQGGFGTTGDAVYINTTGGASGTSTRSTTGIFWRPYGYYDRAAEHAVHIDFPDVPGWLTRNTGSTDNGNGAISETHNVLVGRSPNSWNSEAVLIPIQLFVRRDESKRSMVVDLQNARTLRVDNYDPGQIITLGSDQWRVYPFYRKNADQRDGSPSSLGADHSGTFGWAIRYDPEP